MPCASQTSQKYSAKVKVLVTGSDDTLKNQVKSFVGRELRSLGDVSIVDEKPDSVIALLTEVAIETTDPSRTAVPCRKRRGRLERPVHTLAS